ncbi:hypothetical protein BACCIP111883_01639 [Sutcliffiella rhizosphaerae]|uniref:Uncharacterized protein n=2 Tax=Sutcliffiella rhizosphaerae TaxID=2880967 RepID=A0ABM8YLN2_9BACI|nr:hypothetical protein BACCIP111883_01639 [Sutcliffiella rhizosphaerae]
MHFLNKEESIGILEDINIMLEELIEAHELYCSTYTYKSLELGLGVKELLNELKQVVSMNIRQITLGETKECLKNILKPALCTVNYLLSKIGTNRINHHSYLSVNRELVLAHYYLKKHYKILVEK